MSRRVPSRQSLSRHERDKRLRAAGESRPIGTRGAWADTAGVRAWELEAWRALGEAGQLLAGAVAGYDPLEVAHLRQWTPGEYARHLATCQAWLAQHGRVNFGARL